ncbi:Glycosyl transferase family 2 [Faunimonas pinastri]|uniref:Glycosyl transferase family 2 n=1 Tax=Faunimonas pinastri TaxID=1855383 RepID=A0A1H9CNV1_9HYPH|nr:hypothetical protein [Faunimonas pinastri]SEQ02876.1 Glycosyl transferase family 2 [Faunimonas pinastri]
MAKVLVAGIYLSDRLNSAAHLIYELAGARKHDVTQRWISLDLGNAGTAPLPETVETVTERTPKFKLLNRLTEDAADFDWVLLTDDDVELPPDFLDRLIEHAERFDLAFSQPARTPDSYLEHHIVRVNPGLSARRTRFVEIGPVNLMRRDVVPLLLPFRDDIGMGWGLDFVWPQLLEAAGLRMGIVDATPIAHRIRQSMTAYNFDAAYREMSWTLARHHHLTYDEAMTVLEAWA